MGQRSFRDAVVGTDTRHTPNVRREWTVTLEDLREALSDDDLRALLDQSYNPNKCVSIKKQITVSKFAEDSYTVQRRRTRKSKTQIVEKKSITDEMSKHYLAWKNNDKEADAQSVFGCYLYLYKENFREEDPEWVDQKPRRAILHINKMVSSLTDGNYERVIEFLEKLIPAWAEQMRLGKSFPSSRPTFDSLFIRRKLWAQRYNLIRQWTH